ncbi:AAA family ATPase [Candidatus Poribacteria bacterium]|nr:AAA family ATPase [Candidatus Poribacteria bacterium]MBT5531805.1 AAA family ATPase [Candidatus Poribacteria bacterium]MBT5715129.1 AAA family ATPase [Candidatus Poribacteria bacterium]MBT7807410.1 AAA family ATPase [Candidatus Poribacteria bacterium]
MSAADDATTRLEVAHVLFMDLVGYSRLTVEEQSRRIGALQDIVRETDAYAQAKREASVLAHPAGDGMALAFFGDPSSPARCATEVNEAARDRDDLPLRMGIHSGPIHRAADINDTPNVRGPGINLAQRVMDCGDPGHILLSYMTAEALIESELWKPRLHDLGEVEVKHGIRIRIYSLAADAASEPPRPAKVVELAEKWAAEHRTHNLPAALTSFVGREGQIDEVKERLRETRLLTLTGTGGTGKTRLSLRVGEELLGEYPDGVWFVELASISDPDLIVDAVAAVLDVRGSAEQTLMTTLTRYLDRQRTLIILDNCEHLVEGAATFAQEFLTACSGPRILATSREVLGVNGEATWRVPSLSLPDHDDEPEGDDLTHFEAVRLFVDRARAARSDFALTDENATVVAAICRRLDGIPLAIELAAARMRAMSVEQIHDRLDERFRLLTGGGRASPRRQQTLRALVDWSYRLLDEPQQALFARLSVFAGGFTMEAAEDVCAFGGVEPWDVLDLLLQLVDKSLVIVEEGQSGPRYRMLETLREYGLERIYDGGDADEVRNRHAAYFGKFVSEQESDFQGLRQLEAFDAVEVELDNIRQALSWSIEADVAAAIQLVADLGWFWNERCYWAEALLWQTRSAELREGISPNTFGRLLVNKALMHGHVGQGDAALRDAQEALAIHTRAEDPVGQAWGALAVGFYHQFCASDYPKAAVWYARARDGFSAADRGPEGVLTELFLTHTAMYQGDLETAETRCLRTLLRAREVGAPMCESAAAHTRAEIECRRGRYGLATRRLSEALLLHRRVRNPGHEALTLGNMAMVCEHGHDYALAYSYWVAMVPIEVRLGRQAGWPELMAGKCAELLGRRRDARRWYAASMDRYSGRSNEAGMASAAIAAACLDIDAGRIDAARASVCSAVVIAAQRDAPDLLHKCADVGGRLCSRLGDATSGVLLLGYGSSVRGPPEGFGARSTYLLADQAAAVAESDIREALGVERFTSVHDAGRRLDRDQAADVLRARLCPAGEGTSRESGVEAPGDRAYDMTGKESAE